MSPQVLNLFWKKVKETQHLFVCTNSAKNTNIEMY